MKGNRKLGGWQNPVQLNSTHNFSADVSPVKSRKAPEWQSDFNFALDAVTRCWCRGSFSPLDFSLT